MALTKGCVRPVFVAFQLLPPFVDLNMPLEAAGTA
jgi:hypothetical protein